MDTEAAIDPIRAASRQMVRELGFMNSTLARTALPPSAVHALIEIDTHPGITARRLAECLRLDKSSVSRMLRKLITTGAVRENGDGRDGRSKVLSLSDQGQDLVGSIHHFARAQVAGALARLAPEDRRTVCSGLQLYAQALADSPQQPAAPMVSIESGYRCGGLARITEMHALYYTRTAGFGAHFEAVVASGLGDFCRRLDRPDNQIWHAISGGRVVGAIAIDGEDLGPGVAHLRWFIIEDSQQGQGLGRQLLKAAIAFADQAGFPAIHLWTFQGLHAARSLYEAHGFVLTEERPGTQWGAQVLEQRFVRSRPSAGSA